MTKKHKWALILCVLFSSCSSTTYLASNENSQIKIHPKSVFFVFDYNKIVSNDAHFNSIVVNTMKQSKITFDTISITPLSIFYNDEINVRNLINKSRVDVIIRIKPLEASFGYYKGHYTANVISYLFEIQKPEDFTTIKKYLVSLNIKNGTKSAISQFKEIFEKEIIDSL
jgi:hypothetical protein